MAEIAIRSPLQYLDKASTALREMGLMPEKTDPAPINALLEKISDLDKDKIALIARTLGQTEVFNEVVREQTSQMAIGERYQDITNGFNSIRDDAKRLVDQVSDGKVDIFERGTNMWMKIARGDVNPCDRLHPRDGHRSPDVPLARRAVDVLEAGDVPHAIRGPIPVDRIGFRDGRTAAAHALRLGGDPQCQRCRRSAAATHRLPKGIAGAIGRSPEQGRGRRRFTVRKCRAGRAPLPPFCRGSAFLIA